MNNQNIKYIIGIDEVGRGPIAGPVAVGAFYANQKDINILIKKVKEEFTPAFYRNIKKRGSVILLFLLSLQK